MTFNKLIINSKFNCCKIN